MICYDTVRHISGRMCQGLRGGWICQLGVDKHVRGGWTCQGGLTILNRMGCDPESNLPHKSKNFRWKMVFSKANMYTIIPPIMDSTYWVLFLCFLIFYCIWLKYGGGEGMCTSTSLGSAPECDKFILLSPSCTST